MLKPFFMIAMLAPGRQLTFRRVAVAHTLIVAALSYAAATAESGQVLMGVGYAMLCLGIVEGAALIGWRLTQLPKSQALEFLLTSPIEAKRLFFAESLVGVCRFALVWLSGLPLIGGLLFTGRVDPQDLVPLFVMPFVWGILAGVGLTAWVYEPVIVRRIGELFGMASVLVYLVIGVLAAENLLVWLEKLPPTLGQLIYDCVKFLHNMNPFGIVRYWFSSDRVDWIAWERFELLSLFACCLITAAGFRAAFRLKGHFHDRHYKPIDSSRESQLEKIGDKPLSWWAVRRVMEYSGKVNLWLAGGFSLIYAAFIVASDDWPSWMGKLVFLLLENWGGAPAIATALAVLAAVPAAFQFGLWDSTTQNRCQRLELLLLTDLSSRDYWHASLLASWKRGWGYLFGSSVLWLALGISGRNDWVDVIAAVLGGVLIWCFAFVVGFRAFSTGTQSSGISSLLTLGVPMVLVGFLKMGWVEAANFLPPGLAYMPLRSGVTLSWFVGFTLIAAAILALTRLGLTNCDANLRTWYDQNQGMKSAD